MMHDTPCEIRTLPGASKPDVMKESEVATKKNNIISLLIAVRD